MPVHAEKYERRQDQIKLRNNWHLHAALRIDQRGEAKSHAVGHTLAAKYDGGKDEVQYQPEKRANHDLLDPDEQPAQAE